MDATAAVPKVGSKKRARHMWNNKAVVEVEANEDPLGPVLSCGFTAALLSPLPCKNDQGWQNGTAEPSSKYRGVGWNKASNKYEANIKYDSKQRRIGLYEDEQEAAREYDRAAREYGEKGQLNFPSEKEQAAEEAKQRLWVKCAKAPSKYRGVRCVGSK
jgi:hypothetical protein